MKCLKIVFTFLFLLIPLLVLAQLKVDVLSVNTDQVSLYEKFEIVAGLENASYTNPFDPEQIDLRAEFVAPSGKQWRIFGFYDNYQNRNQWKVRFSPNETGGWRYMLKAATTADSASGQEHRFTAVPSAHHGWLKVSPTNPHYFACDDSTSFYAVGPYYPWGVSNGSNGLELLQNSGANFWGYWNIMYGNEGNILESLSSGLGRYDQAKCGRIDQLIEWSEARNLVMMFAIWPHDLLCQTLSGWAQQWNSNPYKTITGVENFYESQEAWQYQEKQYRYLVARWGYSRAMGVWEIINEINGTDGWVAGKEAEATQWVQKVHDYLKANDPFGRPTTASQSGGRYWPEGYAAIDLPNVHLYETGWSAKFPGNSLRSSLWTYRTVSRQLWHDFAKPAIMGEAGYTNTYGNYPKGSDEYTAVYHNALWVSWASGLAATPVWWASNDRQLMNDNVMAQMRHFASFARQIDYSSQQFRPTDFQISNCDAFAMIGYDMAFGWLREFNGSNISGKLFRISGLPDTVFAVRWYDPWSGQIVSSGIRPVLAGTFEDEIPTLPIPRPDLAFVIQAAATGDAPSRLELLASSKTLLNDGVSKSKITCFLLDDQQRFCNRAENNISFSVEGPGTLVGGNEIQAQNGVAVIEFQGDSGIGTVLIRADSPGLASDSVRIMITNKLGIDDFEGYGSNAGLGSAWRVRGGTAAELFLDGSYVGEGQRSLKVNYSIGNGSPPYAGFSKPLQADFAGANFLRFWLQPDGSGRDLAILLFETSGRYWQFTIKLTDEAKSFEISLSEFVSNDGTTTLDLTNLSEISFNIMKGEAEFGSGVIFLDDVAFLTSVTAPVQELPAANSPDRFVLYQNYPNPFNDSTIIRYFLPNRSMVKVAVYNISGQLVAELVNSVREAGSHSVEWQAKDVGSGVYLFRITVEGKSLVNKGLLIR